MKKDAEIVRMIRDRAPKVPVINTPIKWYQPRLWKYRTYWLPAIGLKDAKEIVDMVREELSAG